MPWGGATQGPVTGLLGQDQRVGVSGSGLRSPAVCLQGARAHQGIADTHHTAGDLAQARHHWEVALRIYSGLGASGADIVRASLTALAHESPNRASSSWADAEHGDCSPLQAIGTCRPASPYATTPLRHHQAADYQARKRHERRHPRGEGWLLGGGRQLQLLEGVDPQALASRKSGRTHGILRWRR